MTTYTVIREDGLAIRRGLVTIHDIADELLRCDGHDWEIRGDSEDGYWLWRTQTWGRKWYRTKLCSFAETEAEAQAEILQVYVERCHEHVIDDDEFDRFEAEARAP